MTDREAAKALRHLPRTPEALSRMLADLIEDRESMREELREAGAPALSPSARARLERQLGEREDVLMAVVRATPWRELDRIVTSAHDDDILGAILFLSEELRGVRMRMDEVQFRSLLERRKGAVWAAIVELCATEPKLPSGAYDDDLWQEVRSAREGGGLSRSLRGRIRADVRSRAELIADLMIRDRFLETLFSAAGEAGAGPMSAAQTVVADAAGLSLSMVKKVWRARGYSRR